MAKPTKRPWAAKYPKAWKRPGNRYDYHGNPQTPRIGLPGGPGDADFDVAYRTVQRATVLWCRVVVRHAAALTRGIV